ncbi:MAG: hypothetical protein J5645_07050 [Lachnospiraceae bacterium]|nr:hypothetical protein [Lachnospiraceae bacterium]
MTEALRKTTERRELQSRAVKLLVLAGVFVAVEIVTEYLLSFTLGMQYRISLTFLIRAIAGFSIGAIGAAVSALTDILGGFIFYGGSMIIGLTVVRALQGLVPGLLLHRKMTIPRIIVSAVISTFFLNIAGLLVRYWTTGTPLSWKLATPSLIVYAYSTVAEIFVLLALRIKVIPVIKALLYNSGTWASAEKTTEE